MSLIAASQSLGAKPKIGCTHLCKSIWSEHLNGLLPSVLLATVPLKERDADFLDSSSAGVSKGPELAN